MLICPICKQALHKEEKRYICMNRHSFDIAKQGYTNLYLKSSQNSGDNKSLVEARTKFLSLHHYQPLCDALKSIVKSLGIDSLVDAGCGEGYYTNQLQSVVKDVYAFDLSKEALKYAARKNKQVHYFLASLFSMPISDQSVDAITNIFAPCAHEEFARLVKTNGYVIKVDPDEDHLWEMKTILYDDVVKNDVLAISLDGFHLKEHHKVSFMMDLNQDEIRALFQMTPYAYKTSVQRSERLLNRQRLKCRASFIIYIFEKE